MSKKIIKLATIKPNKSIERDYLSRLLKLSERMIKEYEIAILKHYGKQEYRIIGDIKPLELKVFSFNNHAIVGDATPATILNRILKQIYKRWQPIFSDKGYMYASKTTDEIDEDTKRHIFREMKKNIGIEPDLGTRRALSIKQATIQENIKLIKSIHEQHFKNINTYVNQSIQFGRDITWLTEKIQAESGVTKRRAKIIARDQCNKATASISQARSIDAGFKKAIWEHSSAGKEPRQSHVDADGKEFDLDKGCYIDGEYILPGQKINCRCFYTLVMEI